MGYNTDNNIFARILAGNSMALFHGNGFALAANARRQVISCVAKASVRHHTLHANHCYRLREITPIICVQNNIKSVN